ncbi:MAG TPA: HAD hydrolase-like protein, partial [Opitutaceae bacterium]|nr:HAD hydrolase-like protein [Opitutaceae bacterium]
NSAMVVFDVDGTLIGGEAADWTSFEDAFTEAAGFALDERFFLGLQEVTAQSIVHEALAACPLEERKIKERAVCRGYLQRLEAAHRTHTGSFQATAGAHDLLRELRAQGVPVAIATGDWRETISFKLRASGLPVEGLPMVTSSEYLRRADIIAAAVALAGRTLDEALYVGDGLWDLRATQALGIPFVGVGHRREKLRAAGAPHVLADLTPGPFLQAREATLRARR